MQETYKKIILIISKKRSQQMFTLLILLFIGMALEMLGLGIILPVLAVVLDESTINNYPKITSWLNNMGLTTYRQISIFLVVLLPIVYFVKTIFLILVNFYQNKLVQVTIRDIIDKLFSRYLDQPYESFVSRNSSEYIKVIQTETLYFTTYIQAVLTIITESALTIAVLIVFILVEPIGAISIFLFFGLLSSVFFQLSKNKLKSWGKKREELDKSISKIILEALGNIREVKIFNIPDFFTDKLKIKNFNKAELTYFQNTLIQSPRFYLELVSVIGLSLFIIGFLLQDKNIVELISIIGVFVAGSFRVIPSLNRLIQARQHIRYHDNTLDLIFNELDITDNQNLNDFKDHKKALDFNSKLELSNISFKYSNTDKYVLKNLNFKIYNGESVGVIGKSGSGKSTFVDILSGLLFPLKGDIVVDDKLLDSINFPNWKNLIGYVSQITNLIDDTITANVAFGDKKPNLLKVKSVLKDSQLYEFIKSLPEGMETKIGEKGVLLSGGQIQRLAIARALYKSPKILILDEATSSLDNKTEKKIIQSINNLKRKVTILMIAHRLTTLTNCDRIYELHNNQFTEIKKEKLKI
jgi:ATP-binding cassette, subfamily B, bacterial PglK